jgi:hypothetical protein
MAPQPKSKEFITSSDDEDPKEPGSPRVDEDSLISLSEDTSASDDDTSQSPSNSTQEGGPAYGFSASKMTIYHTYCSQWSGFTLGETCRSQES